MDRVRALGIGAGVGIVVIGVIAAVWVLRGQPSEPAHDPGAAAHEGSAHDPPAEVPDAIETPTTEAPTAETPTAEEAPPASQLCAIEEHRVLSAADIDARLSAPDELAGMGRARLSTGDDGQVDGFVLSAVRDDGWLFELGLRSGDVLNEASGFPLTSLEAAMRAMDALRSADRVELVGERDEQVLCLTYEITRGAP